MQKFTSLKSKVIPLPIADIDTDMIIPAQFLTSVSRDGYAENLFRRLKDNDPAFPLNKAEYKDAKILLAGNNFGCGSSREHAVWAILGAGIRVVISSSFADIFSNNSGKNGLVLVNLLPEDLETLQKEAAQGNYVLEVNLENQTVTMPDGKELKFQFDAFRKHCILNGLDDLDYLLSKKHEIDKYRQSKKEFSFFTSLSNNN